LRIVISEPVYLPAEYRDRLRALGSLKAHDSMPASDEEFVRRIKDADIVIAGRYGFSGESIRQARRLKMIALWQTGYDNVDLDAATKRGVVVSNVHDYAHDTVAEFAFALALNLLRKVDKADMNLRKGIFDWRLYVGEELMGKTLGVIGLGSIGRRVVQIAHGFNMHVLSVTAHPSPERAKELGVEFTDLDALMARSDVVSLHVPLTPETEHMIGAAQLGRMKPTAVLINTARGKIVDENALVEALREKRIAGAGLDVFETEPLPMNSPLLELDNAVLTPHIAFLSKESVDECTRVTVENVEMFIEGRPQNVVNRGVLAKRAQESTA
jgi:phosphoglycerate dehydrogenase-like enzyme